MKRFLRPVLLAALTTAAGCGAQGLILGIEGSYLLTVRDAVAVPGEEVQLQARFQGGDFLRGRQGHVIRFDRGGKIYRAASTDAHGVAAVTFTPAQAGDYRFVAEVSPDGLPDDPPKPGELLVACRAADTPIAVVDLDKTVVASGFHTVLLGNPTPMARSAEVLKRLAGTHTVVFLTHRPDYFGPKSKTWLKAKGYPPGPVLLSTVGSFLKGSGAYKSEMIAALKKRFTKVEVGIGDKTSDVQAYHENGLKAFLIIQVADGAAAAGLEALADSIKDLPDAIQVVTGWDQVEEGLFGRGKYPRSAMEKKLRSLAAERKKEEAAAGP